ncbi:hypothetical protein BURMUCGD1_4574 [Burkholderia multivorans CGD1]|nr:hypothetical protein BURMUCGD1_4574 [Burkholderia multivorans CGD1]
MSHLRGLSIRSFAVSRTVTAAAGESSNRHRAARLPTRR